MSTTPISSCKDTCDILESTVLTADEMLTLVDIDPYCVPLCEMVEQTVPFVSREGVGFVMRDTAPKDDLKVVGMDGRVQVPGVSLPQSLGVSLP